MCKDRPELAIVQLFLVSVDVHRIFLWLSKRGLKRLFPVDLMSTKVVSCQDTGVGETAFTQCLNHTAVKIETSQKPTIAGNFKTFYKWPIHVVRLDVTANVLNQYEALAITGGYALSVKSRHVTGPRGHDHFNPARSN